MIGKVLTWRLLARLLLFFAVFQVMPQAVRAQVWAKIDENQLIESKWRYTYTMHLETNTIIHQAEDTYRHFLYFRYDSTYEQFLNGSLTDGRWRLEGNTLHYPFRFVKKFTVTTLTDFALDLEFQQPNSRGTYVYHFIRVESGEAPFLRRENELPEIVIATKGKKLEPGLPKFSKSKAKTDRRKRKAFISVELVGGGFYGGIDPVLRDHIIIKNDGRLIKEFKSLNEGLIVTKKNIPREELEQFAEWLMAQKFFDFERQYDCKTATCEKRKYVKPLPMPLRLSVTYGNARKIVTISIWGKDKNGDKYVDYPPVLDQIIDGIQRMANRLEAKEEKKRKS